MTMKSEQRAGYLTRDSILRLLSDDEVARVSTAETADQLALGDEYLDLEQLEHGVRSAFSAPTPMGRVLPRKAVRESTWFKILAQLADLHAGGPGAAPPAAHA